LTASGAALVLAAFVFTSPPTAMLDEDVITSDDKLIIESSVLLLLADERQSSGWRHKFDALLDFNTSTDIGWVWSTGIDYDRKTGSINGYRIPDEIERHLKRRNQRSCRLRFRPRDNRIRLCDLESELFNPPGPRTRFPRMPITEMVERFPGCRHWVQVSLPGYSSDGTQAIVQLHFGPDMHGAFARYWFHRVNGQWRLKAQQCVHMN